MAELFQICVDILKWIGQTVGITYEEANIWIFVIIHPLLTLVFMYLWRRAVARNRRLLTSQCKC
mgnify:CR=1 FL=1